MEDAVIRARLMVRVLGLLIVGLCARQVVRGVGEVISLRPRRPTGIGDQLLYFYSFPINIGRVLDWLVGYGVPAAVFLIGVVLVWRGSRRLERRVLHELTRA